MYIYMQHGYRYQMRTNKKNVYSQKVKAGNLEADTRALLQICFTEAE